MRLLLIIVSLFSISFSFAQKKPLDHTVYDSWQHIGERMISNNGKWVVYTIDPQEGDNELVIQSSDAKYKKTIARGYNAVITEDSRYAIFKIKPFYNDTRNARIKKKRPDDMPKDSFAILEFGKDILWKIPRVKTFKVPEKEFGWVAYHLEKIIDKIETDKKKKPDNYEKQISDSLNRIIDSLQRMIATMPEKKKENKDGATDTYDENWNLTQDAEGDETPAAPVDAGTDLILRNLYDSKEKIFTNVLEYYFSKKGQKLLIEQGKNPKDSMSKQIVLLYDLKEGRSTVVSKGGNDFKNFVFDEDGSQLAYVAERDAKPKELQKFYRLWYYKKGMDSATLLADKNSAGMKLGMTISEFGNLNFSKSGKRLFFGTAAIQPLKDTSLVEFENPKVDIWHYNDDYLQPVQLNRLQRDLQTSYLALYDFNKNTLLQLGSEQIPAIYQTNEGDGEQFVGVTDFGKRIESQWAGNTKKDIYSINPNDGTKKLVKKDMNGFISPQYMSPTGKYILWYESKAKNYFVWDGVTIKNISEKIKAPLWNEEHDSPSDAPPYGVMGWHEGDSAVYLYDKFDVWKVDMNQKLLFTNITKTGRTNKEVYRYVRLDTEERFLKYNQSLYFRLQNHDSKNMGIRISSLRNNLPSIFPTTSGAYALGIITKAKNANTIIYNRESYTEAPDIYLNDQGLEIPVTGLDMKKVNQEVKLSSINLQQKDYNWGTAELFNWKAYNGKEATGIVYKPEDFDSKKKYPMIVYFYETLSDQLYDYKEPAPIRSAINVPFFVSRGYIIFIPDIHYTTGHPGKNAYDYIVSGARALVRKGWVDSTSMALQGHSWGGYQAAQVATMTKLFKAVWAGAPVANMTSAYGGIRWESGVSRQFQYEKTQSRIGATLWEKPHLYIENSPLFHLNKVTAPMVVMANDADGAVPWYQGIEMFTGLRRLGKKVWMFNYNGQGHGLTQRQDMRDYQIRMQQFFDWILKGDKPAKWIIEGVPAVKK
ncbi:MAG: prolyl oligopeptidase family serine peptidase, partial [Chitinophagaceae bacterium]